jgi:hypothetical protein
LDASAWQGYQVRPLVFQNFKSFAGNEIPVKYCSMTYSAGYHCAGQWSESVARDFSIRTFLFGTIVGISYGLAVRAGIDTRVFNRFGGAMTWAFLFGVPFAMGFITVFIAEYRRRQPLSVWILWPVVAVLGGTLGTFLTFMEGTICIVMFFPIALVCSILGGVLAGLLLRFSRHSRTNDVIAGAVLLFPLMVVPWEHKVLYSNEIHITRNFVDIAAPAPVIWRNIERVRAIQSSELPDSWSHRIGFPNPIEATLSKEGVGGVRHATFTGGVLFIETIDSWEPNQRLGFSIRAQTDAIPNTTLDQHVRIGGAFFDVLHGEYRLELLENGMVRLHLSSQQRLSTDFNWYARIWSDATMADLQSRILKVVKARCEDEARGHQRPD